jgi:hypothetical protein
MEIKTLQPTDSLVLSYLELRKSIGLIGMLLPLIVSIGKILIDSPGILGSISAYYYSLMGGVFVGSLCAIGVFLWAYRGYDMRDVIAGHVAGVAAVGVALFPTAPEGGAASFEQSAVSAAHATFAAIFFLTLAYFTLFLFRKTHTDGVMTQMKRVRNIVYGICGVLILVCISLIAASHFLPADSPILALHPTFWLESIAIIAFGISWFVKGEAILQD